LGDAVCDGKKDLTVVSTEVKLEHLEQISGSYAHFPAVKAWVELVDAGNAFGETIPINWDDRATVLRAAGNVVGLIVWRYAKWQREAFICLGWVHPAWRREGRYRQMYDAVKAEAITMGARFLAGGVLPGNEAIRASAKAMGRAESSIMLREVIGE
jgi:ribosomal protein S18 acetylase RimI-like enzyme